MGAWAIVLALTRRTPAHRYVVFGDWIFRYRRDVVRVSARERVAEL